jgi:ATP-dependent Clp protease adaptor protein ClpS
MVPAPAIAPESVTDEATELAPQWRVILHDDPITTFEFVVDVLRQIFEKPQSEAWRITREAHTSGSALVTTTTYEEAVSRCDQAHSLARTRGFPLTLTIET